MRKSFGVGAMACFFAAVGLAADGTWTGTVSGAWSSTANWQGGTVASGSNYVAYLPNLPGPVQITNDVAPLKLQGLLLLGGAYTIYGQPIAIEGTASASPYGIVVSGGTHTVSSTLNVNRSMHVAVEAGATLTTSGRLDYLGNNTVVKRGGGEWAFAGWCAETNANAYFDVTNGTFRLKSGAVFTKLGGTRENFRVGYGGNPGTVVVERATMNIDGFVLGHDTANAKGYLLVDGGTFSANTTDESNPVLVGRYGLGVMSLSNNATANIANWFNLGVYNRAEVYIGSGSSLSAGRISFGWKDSVGASYTGPAVINIGDGSLTAVNQLFWRVGTLTTRTNVVTVGDGIAGHGRLSIPATCRTSADICVARLVLDGGTLEMTGLKYTVNGETLTNYLYGLNQLWVGRAGATLNTGTNSVTITQAVTRDPSVPRDGGITKSGSGTLTLTGGYAYNGATVVAQGTLCFKSALPTNAVSVLAGAALSLADGQYRTFAPSALTMGQGGESVVVIELGPSGASDALALPQGAQLGTVRFVPVSTAGAPNALAGDYVVATYAGGDPDVSGWSLAVPAGTSATFDVQPALKRVVLHIAAVATGSSVWINPGSGDWNAAGNWNTAPASSPATQVVFGDALGSAAQVSLASPVTVGLMTLDTPYACALNGAGVTFGETGSGGTLSVLQGSHALGSALTLPADLSLVAQPGASVILGGGATGSGRVSVSGGGTLVITNGAFFDVPLTVNGAILGATDNTTVDSALTVGDGGVTLSPSAGKTLTLSGDVDGTGPITKSGASVAVMSGATSCAGLRTIQNGTLTLSSLTNGGDLVIGEGTLKYTGPDVATPKGFTVRTADAKKGAAFETDADVTFNGNIKTDNGVFIKAGKGTVTFAAPGFNVFGTGVGSDNYSALINRGANGESPTQGLRVFQIMNGKVVLGGAGQTNSMNQTIAVGCQSTTASNAETAAHLEINGGVVQCGIITLARGNGTAVTAPTGLVSSVRINAGVVQSGGLYMAMRLNDMTTYPCNARPLFEMNGGEFYGAQLWLGNNVSPVQPRVVLNSGFMAVTGSTSGDVRLAYDGGCTGEVVLAGGTLAVSNVVIRLADTNATAKSMLRLNGGRLITRGFERLGSGVGELHFNGGVLQPCQNMALSNITASVVQAGGLVANVPQGVALTVSQTLTHDAALGATPDGGVVKLGPGTLALNYSQTYTGPTIVSGGVLRVAGTLAVTNMTLCGGATLLLTDGGNRIFGPSAFTAGDAGGPARIEMEVAADGGAYDVLALPDGAGVKLTLCLFKTGTSQRFVSPGRYPLVTFGGAAPNTAAWSVEGMPNIATFETEGSTVYVRIGASAATPSVWTSAAGGDWSEAGNWATAPLNAETASVLFGSAIAAPAIVNTGTGVTFGYLAVDNAVKYTWAGGAMTLGSADSNATVRVAQGAHEVNADLSVPSLATLAVDPGATLTVDGAVTGAGSLLVTGGGTVAMTNGPALGVPVTFDGATFAIPQSTTYGSALALGAGGAVFAPATGRTVTVSGDVTGVGGLTKTGSSILNLSGGADFSGELVVRNGTVSMSAEPGAPLVIGEGTFRYTGSGATFARGYTLRTTSASQAGTLYSDADITLNGPAKADAGCFIKLGSGTLTYAYAGENTLSTGDRYDMSNSYLNHSPYGDSPTQGYRSYSVYNGKVVLGAEGQTNRVAQAIIIGGMSTTNADAETAGQMEINGGVNLFADYITVGRGNGTAVTAPTGLVSTLTLNGGQTTANGFWMAAMLTNMTALTARPQFVMNGGALSTTTFYCGNTGGTPKPKIFVNGGTLTVGPNDAMKLVNGPGIETEMTISGGTVCMSNQTLNVADNYAGGKGVLNLNGGRLIANNIVQNGTNAAALVFFNGGVFQPNTSASLSTMALTNRAGGAVFDVPQGLTYTLARTIGHDEALGATADGGLTKSGAGTLVISAAQAYTGPTVLAAGTLAVSAPASNTLSLAGLALGSASGPEAALVLTADRAGFGSGGAVAVSGDLFLGKTALTLVMRETGGAPATNGTYVVFTCAGTVSGSAADLRVANGVYGKSYTFSVSGAQVLLTVATATADAVVWSNAGGGDWAVAGNWITAPGAGAAGMKVGFGDAITVPATVTLDAAATAGSMFFNNANTYTVAGSGSLAFDGTNDAPVLVAEQGVQTLAVAASLVDNTTVSVTNSAEMQLTGNVTGNGKLTKDGAGRMLLAGANTYAGGTEVLAGTLDVTGSSALGSGTVTLNGGALAGKGTGPAVVANAGSILKNTYIGAYAPFTLSGNWTSTGNVLVSKVSSNELTIAGSMKPSSGSANRLEHREGAVRFASGSDALFTSTSARECIDFRNPASASVSRSLTVEAGATVSTRMLYVGYGASNAVTVTGGTLSMTGYPGTYLDAFIMGAAGPSPKVVDRFTVTGGTVYGGDSAWCLMGVDKGRTTLDISNGTVSWGAVSMGHRTENNIDTGVTASSDVFVRSGLLEARQRWNWMGDLYGPRLNAVYLYGGRLRLPATFAGVTNRYNQARLVLDGGTLETPGGGTDAEDPADYLKGLKQLQLGAGGGAVDTLGRSVAFAQRVSAQSGAEAAGLVKRGTGTLTLAKPPLAGGLLDVQAGTLRVAPDVGTAYPDDPMFRQSYEAGVATDDSAYRRNATFLAGNSNNLALITGVNGAYALAFNGTNGMVRSYTDDLQLIDTFTVSAWVRQSAYQSVNQAKSFFGTIAYSNVTHEFVLRVDGGNFRMLATGPDNKTYGQLLLDVTNALPLNTWAMLTVVANGTNGISMYVNGVKRVMRVTENGGSSYAYVSDYGAGRSWYFQPPSRTSGNAFAIGTTGPTDAGAFFRGDLDDLSVYRRALSASEMALLYQAKVPLGRRVRVATGAALDLAGTEQELAEATGQGQIDNGTAKVTGVLNPGDWPASAAGALLSAANLTLATNMTYVCDWTPAANDLVDVWGTLTVNGAGTIDLGLASPSQMPGAPRFKSFPVMYYSSIVGAANFSQWKVTGLGRSGNASVSAANGVVTVSLEVFSGTLLRLR